MAKRNDRNQVIYCITNKQTGEQYIGRTVARGRAFLKSMKIRWEGHMYAAFVEQRKYLFPEYLRTLAPDLVGREWKDITEADKRKFSSLFTKEVLEVVRGRAETAKREADLINTIRPVLNTKMQGA